MVAVSELAAAHELKGGGPLSEAKGAPRPDRPGTERSEVSGSGKVSSYSSGGEQNLTTTASYGAKPPGRPKEFHASLRVPMTRDQRATVDALAAAGGCPGAEAIRRLIDGAELPEPREVVAVDPDQYRELLDALASIRTELNRGVGNLYRLTRDSYQDGQPEPAELSGLRADLRGGLDDLSDLAAKVKEVSPW